MTAFENGKIYKIHSNQTKLLKQVTGFKRSHQWRPTTILGNFYKFIIVQVEYRRDKEKYRLMCIQASSS
jgi:hypothetical protein